MAKGLFINRDQLERVINANCTLKLIELKKKEQGFYRYHVEKEDKEFSIDVYYTKKKGNYGFGYLRKWPGTRTSYY